MRATDYLAIFMRNKKEGRSTLFFMLSLMPVVLAFEAVMIEATTMEIAAMFSFEAMMPVLVIRTVVVVAMPDRYNRWRREASRMPWLFL